MGHLGMSMERTVRLNGLVLWVALFLVSSLARLGHGDDLDKEARNAILETFEIDGQTIDCIDIYKQVAFRHPLLANHTIQMKPTNYIDPDKIRGSSNPEGASHPWHLPKSCPQGSVPVTRSRIKGLDGNHHSSATDALDLDGGIAYRKDGSNRRVVRSAVEINTGRKYVGAKSILNLWNPKVRSWGDSSSSQIWAYSKDKTVGIRAGWQVYPALNGDDKTTFFISWTTDGSKRVCYNLKCPGFVHTSHFMNVDSYLQPVSVYGGQQYEITLEISKDPRTSHWWVYLQGYSLGYWPKELVPALEGGADVLAFGGEATNGGGGGGGRLTEMGSGHPPGGGYQKAAFQHSIRTSENPDEYNPPDYRDAQVVSDCGGCYGLQPGGQIDRSWGFFLYYGGPGTNPGCTC